jgi:hypothetical protein
VLGVLLLLVHAAVLPALCTLLLSAARGSADDRAVVGCDDRDDRRTRRRTVTAKDEFNRQVRLTAFLTVGLVAALIFGIIVLAGGDWIPGSLIVAASLIGLARQIPVINKLCRQASPSPPHGKPTG